MSSIPTTYLPLTTTFTAPAECSNGPWIYQGVPTTWWKQGGDNVASCFPPGFPFSNSRIIYSPGICPGGWTSACDRMLTTSGSTQNIVSCCPASFECASTSSGVHDWEDQFGCASPFDVNPAAWDISSGASFVSSIYQLPVMIVEATTTSTSSTASATPAPSPSSTSTPASTAASTSAPTASITASSTPTTTRNGTLSKGAIAGVAIGSVVGAAVIALLAYIAWTVRKKHRADVTGPPTMAQISEPPVNAQYDASNYHSTEPTEMDGVGMPVPVHELKGGQPPPVHELRSH